MACCGDAGGAGDAGGSCFPQDLAVRLRADLFLAPGLQKGAACLASNIFRSKSSGNTSQRRRAASRMRASNVNPGVANWPNGCVRSSPSRKASIWLPPDGADQGTQRIRLGRLSDEHHQRLLLRGVCWGLFLDRACKNREGRSAVQEQGPNRKFPSLRKPPEKLWSCVRALRVLNLVQTALVFWYSLELAILG